jgi:hypothetical protein
MLKLTMLAAIVLVATAAHAEQTTRNFYDAHGNFAGTARTHGNATTFIDKRGRFVGTAINRGKGMALHDRHGNFTRSVVRPLPQQVRPAPLKRPFAPPAMSAR